MPTQLLVLKSLASVGGAVAVGGGSYVVYQNSDSIKNIFVRKKQDDSISTNQTDTSPSKPLTTKLFVVRYKSGAATETLDADTPITCDIDTDANLPCKIYQFQTKPKTDNVITATDTSKLTAVTGTNAAFVANSHLVIELTNTTKTATQLQNKTITLKKGTSTLGVFEFDQILTGETAITAKSLAAIEETYIVKKSDSWTASSITGATSYRCKLAAATSKIDNYDSTCKLVKIAVSGSETVTTFEGLKGLNTKITAANLVTETATDSYFKLIVDKNLMYNLAFEESASSPIQVELLKDNAPTAIGSLEIKQKFDGTKFIGKTKLLLAKAKQAETTALAALTHAKCSLNGTDTTVVASNQFECSLTKTTSGTAESKNWVFGTTQLATSDTIALNDFFIISLKNEKNISDFDNKSSIFYQISTNATAGTALDKNIELELVALMSGEVETNKNPMFIAEKTAAK